MKTEIKKKCTSRPGDEGRDQIISYQKLRAFIGLTGLALPVIIVGGCIVFGASNYAWQISISHYYYTYMHIFFVGILCLLGGFLITYKGRDAWESRTSNLAGFCAIGVAACPTPFSGYLPEDGGDHQYIQLKSLISDGWGYVHFGFAGTMFACFMLFCLLFFQKPDSNYSGTDLQKFERRKLIYKLCGWIILFSMILIFLFNTGIIVKSGIFRFSTFIFETSALWAFGTAWLIKGSAVLKEMPALKSIVDTIR